jgi:hypothetical protein
MFIFINTYILMLITPCFLVYIDRPQNGVTTESRNGGLICGGEKDSYSVFGNQEASSKGDDLMTGDDARHFGNGVRCSG